MDRRDRMRLMKFVCSFAWADLEIRPEERAFVADLIERLGLDAEETGQVAGWLQTPPPPDAIDPTQVPREHRQIFLDAVQGVVVADGRVAPEERENLELFRDLMG
jgi:tellurite resistance protein